MKKKPNNNLQSSKKDGLNDRKITDFDFFLYDLYVFAWLHVFNEETFYMVLKFVLNNSNGDETFDIKTGLKRACILHLQYLHK